MYWTLSAVNNLEVKMTSPKDDKGKTRIPYEAPLLFDLGGGGAAAGAGGKACRPGGSPTGSNCANGTTASGGACRAGTNAAGGKCNPGGVAGDGRCTDGGVPSKKCKAGSTK